MEQNSTALIFLRFSRLLAVVITIFLAWRISTPASFASTGSAGIERKFWTLKEDHSGRWWFVSPDGKPVFLNGVTTVGPRRDQQVVAWAKGLAANLHRVGFRSLGCWCASEVHDAGVDLPFAECLGVWTWCTGSEKVGQKRLWYSAGDEQNIEAYLTKVADPLRNNQQLIGYYLDNELNWDPATVGIDIYFDAGAGSPQRAQVVATIRASCQDQIAEFNSQWKQKLRDWNSFTLLSRLPPDRPANVEKEWLRHLARDYFKTASGLLRKHDANHLILGIKFRSRPEQIPAEVVEESADYVDAESFDIYPLPQAQIPQATLNALRLARKPVVVAEFSFYSLQNASGLDQVIPNYPTPCNDQQARAAAYRAFVSGLAKKPYLVGADWFQWRDPLPSSREPVNFGVFSSQDAEYPELVKAIQDTSAAIDDIHSTSK